MCTYTLQHNPIGDTWAKETRPDALIIIPLPFPYQSNNIFSASKNIDRYFSDCGDGWWRPPRDHILPDDRHSLTRPGQDRPSGFRSLHVGRGRGRWCTSRLPPPVSFEAPLSKDRTLPDCWPGYSGGLVRGGRQRRATTPPRVGALVGLRDGGGRAGARRTHGPRRALSPSCHRLSRGGRGLGRRRLRWRGRVGARSHFPWNNDWSTTPRTHFRDAA